MSRTSTSDKSSPAEVLAVPGRPQSITPHEVYHGGMPAARKNLGDFAERVAVAHLEAKGYRIIQTKFRVREGEIDVVAQRDGVIVLVEVKARRSTAVGPAIDGISKRKAKRLLAAGEVFAARHPELPQDRRIDLIAIDLDASGRVVSLEHLESAVEDGY